MSLLIPIEYGNYYHIFNRGNNYEKLFSEDDDFKYFMKLYGIFVHEVVETYAWCLMGNHFHFLVQIKEESDIGFLNPYTSKSEKLEEKWKLIAEPVAEKLKKKPKPS